MIREIREALSLAEATWDNDARAIRSVLVCKAGESLNRNLHVAEAMRSTYIPALEGVPVFFGHNGSTEARSDPRNVGGSVRNLRFEESDGTLRGDLYYTELAEPVLRMFKEATDRGESGRYGLSIAAQANAKVVRHGGRTVRRIESLVQSASNSVDLVVFPSAGGTVFESLRSDELAELDKLTLEELKAARPDLIAALAAETPPEKPLVEPGTPPVTPPPTPPEKPEPKSEATPDEKFETAVKPRAEETVAEAVKRMECQMLLETELRRANLPADMETSIRESYSGQVFDAKRLQKDIADRKKWAGAAEERKFITEGQRVMIAMEPLDKLQIALDQLVGVCDDAQGVKPFRGLREAYVAYTGDVDITGQVRLTEAVSTAQFANALGNTLQRKVIKDYRAYPGDWRKIATVGSAPDFRSQERIKIGYLSDLPTVATETEDYPDIADPTDEKTTGSVGQKGAKLQVTRKAIINDDIGSIAKIAGRLGRAAARTLDKYVFYTMLASNATYTGIDSYGFFYARGGTNGPTNLGSTALSQLAIMDTITLMDAFTEPGSSEKFQVLRPGDLYLIVPAALRWTAEKINKYMPVEEDPNPLYEFFGANSERIIVSPWFTDTNDWYLAMNPDVMDWIEVLFLQGRQEPEIFLADNPLVGDMFDADRLTYKIRFEFGVMFNDCRGAFKHVVT